MMRSIVCGASCVCSVAKTRWPVSAAVSAVWIVSRSRISPTRITSGSWRRAAFRPAAKVCASEPISRWLTMHFLWPWRNSIGSSMVMMCSSRVALISSIDRGQRGRLARAGRARDEHEAARPLGQLVQDDRQAELVDGLDRERDQAEGRPDRAALVVGVDTEASASWDRVGEVDLPVGLQALALIVGQDRVDRLARLLGGHDGVVLQRLEASPDPYGWMCPGREMQVGGVALDDLEQQVGEVKAHYARLSTWPPGHNGLSRRNGRPYDPRHGWLTPRRARAPARRHRAPTRRRAPPLARRGRALRRRRRQAASEPARGGMPRLPGSRRFWRFLLVLLVLNIVLAQLIPSSEDKRLDVPYTFFRQQVTAGNVKEVNAKNDVIQGDVPQGGEVREEGARDALRDRPPDVRPGRRAAQAAARQARRGQRPADRRGPRLPGDAADLLRPDAADRRPVHLLPAPQRGGRRRRRARARALEGQALRRLRHPRHASRTSPASTRSRTSSRRSSTSSRTPTATASSARRSPRACCCPASRAPARRCSRAPSPARPTCRSSRSAPRSSSRWSSASAPRACATSSTRPRRPPRRSSSSTSSTRSAARAAAAAASAATTSASRRSTRSSPRWTASPARRASSCSPRRTAPRCSTPRCCAPGASTAA